MKRFLMLFGFNLMLFLPVLAQKEAVIEKSIVTLQGGAKQSTVFKMKEREFKLMSTVPLEEGTLVLNFKERDWRVQNLPTINPIALNMRDGDESNSAYGIKYANTLKIGAGNYGRTLFDFKVGSAPKENKFLGLYVNHDGNLWGPTQDEFSARNENQVKFVSRSFGAKTFWESHLSYNRNLTHFYGQKDIPKYLTAREMVMSYERINYFGKFSNAKKDTQYDYFATTEFNALTNVRNERELLSTSQFNYVHNYSKNFKVQFVSDFIYSEYSSSKVIQRQFSRIKPSFVFNSSRVSITAGLNFVNQMEGNNASESSVFPLVNLDFGSTDFFHFFAGLGGDILFNSYHALSGENLWLAPNVILKNTDQVGNLFIGIKGADEKNLDFEFKYAYSEFSNLPFFINAKEDPSKFEIAYLGDLKKVQVYNLTGHVNFHIGAHVSSGFKFDYAEYEQLQSFTKAYHRPNLALSWTNTWKLSDHLILSPDVYYLNGLYGLNQMTQKPVALEDITDVNVKLNILLSPKVSLILSGNNLLGKSYQRFLNYAVQGLNYHGALSFSF